MRTKPTRSIQREKNPNDGHFEGDEDWVERETLASGFADLRPTHRFGKLLSQVSEQIGATVPMACQDWANTKAAYRFFDNERVSEAEILAGHFASTKERLVGVQGLALVLRDTTEFSFQREKEIGLLHRTINGKNSWGAAKTSNHLRPAHAFEPGRDYRGAAIRACGSEVLDPPEIQGMQCAEKKNQSYAGAH